MPSYRVLCFACHIQTHKKNVAEACPSSVSRSRVTHPLCQTAPPIPLSGNLCPRWCMHVSEFPTGESVDKTDWGMPNRVSLGWSMRCLNRMVFPTEGRRFPNALLTSQIKPWLKRRRPSDLACLALDSNPIAHNHSPANFPISPQMPR
jgi:hypothetical protein